MICPILRRKLAWSCATNMSWDTNQAITSTTPGGAKLRSNCGHPRVSLPCLSTPRPDTTPRPTRPFFRFGAFRLTLASLLLMFLHAPARCAAQIPVNVPPPPPPQGQQPGTPQGGKIKVDVNLVVLHTTV